MSEDEKSHYHYLAFASSELGTYTAIPMAYAKFITPEFFQEMEEKGIKPVGEAEIARQLEIKRELKKVVAKGNEIKPDVSVAKSVKLEERGGGGPKLSVIELGSSASSSITGMGTITILSAFLHLPDYPSCFSEVSVATEISRSVLERFKKTLMGEQLVVICTIRKVKRKFVIVAFLYKCYQFERSTLKRGLQQTRRILLLSTLSKWLISGQ